MREQGAVEITELSRLMPDISRVTLRRDIAEMAESELLRRTHGGAVLPDDEALSLAGERAAAQHDARREQLSDYSAIILGPLAERGADALRRSVRRHGLPFLAESAPQEGGRYLGPDNAEVGRALGDLAGRQAKADSAAILHVCVSDLANTRERSNGFDAGFRETFTGDLSTQRINGQGHFRIARRVAVEALRANPDITVGFAVNDHSAIALIEAAEQEGRDLAVYAVGGEDPDFIARVTDDGPLAAVGALFPESVGVIGVEAAIDMIGAVTPSVEPIITPHRVVTGDNFDEIYESTGIEGPRHALRAAAFEVMVPALRDPAPDLQGRRISFVPHYPAHDWYRLMGAAMRARAEAYGAEVEIAPPQEGIAREIDRLRGRIAAQVAARIGSGQTVILGQGDTSRQVAIELTRRMADLPEPAEIGTIVTNDLEIMRRLTGTPGVKVIVTGGEFQAADQCFVGPSVGAVLERLRADLAFLTVDGVTAGFGVSMVDERLALVAARAAAAARRVIVMADHVSVGVDANHRALDAARLDELVTDDGVLPDDRARLRAAGVVVTIADEEDTPPRSDPGPARNPVSGRTRQ